MILATILGMACLSFSSMAQLKRNSKLEPNCTKLLRDLPEEDRFECCKINNKVYQPHRVGSKIILQPMCSPSNSLQKGSQISYTYTTPFVNQVKQSTETQQYNQSTHKSEAHFNPTGVQGPRENNSSLLTIVIIVFSGIIFLVIAFLLCGLTIGYIHYYYKKHNRNKDNKIHAHKTDQRGAEHSQILEPSLTSHQPNTQREEPSLSTTVTGLPQPFIYSPTVQVTETPQINALEPERVPLMVLVNLQHPPGSRTNN
jgi:hypothetical protein